MLTTQTSRSIHRAARHESTTSFRLHPRSSAGVRHSHHCTTTSPFLSPGATSACVISGVRKGRRCSAARWESLDLPIIIINWEPLAVTILGNQCNRSDNFHSIISARHRRPSAIQRYSRREDLLEHSFRGTSNRIDRCTIHVMTQASIASPVQLTSCTTPRHESPRLVALVTSSVSNVATSLHQHRPLQQYIIGRPIASGVQSSINSAHNRTCGN